MPIPEPMSAGLLAHEAMESRHLLEESKFSSLNVYLHSFVLVLKDSHAL